MGLTSVPRRDRVSVRRRGLEFFLVIRLIGFGIFPTTGFFAIWSVLLLYDEGPHLRGGAPGVFVGIDTPCLRYT